MVQLNHRWAPHWLQETPLFMINPSLTFHLYIPYLPLDTVMEQLICSWAPHQSQHDPPPFVINPFDTPHLPS